MTRFSIAAAPGGMTHLHAGPRATSTRGAPFWSCRARGWATTPSRTGWSTGTGSVAWPSTWMPPHNPEWFLWIAPPPRPRPSRPTARPGRCVHPCDNLITSTGVQGGV